MLCSQGQYCLGVQPDPANPAGQPGFCAQACNAAPSPDPVATCTSGTCVDMSGAADGTVQLARLGLCLPGCSLYGTDSCPADALGNSCGCAPAPPYDGTGYCWPLSPTPGQPGAACTLGTGKDSRNPCGDRLYCTDLGQGGECLGWCDTNTCPAGAACGSCKPSPSQCVQAANTVGICIP
jgi:hypothetical protein